jgi:hypothetical protein
LYKSKISTGTKDDNGFHEAVEGSHAEKVVRLAHLPRRTIAPPSRTAEYEGLKKQYLPPASGTLNHLPD